MRLTTRVFWDLAIWMIAFGLFVGIVFPFFAMFVGVSRDTALSPAFIVSCLLAGATVGWVNIWLARSVVGSRMRTLALRMNFVQGRLKDALRQESDVNCDIQEECFVETDSDDEIGESASAFNQLVRVISVLVKSETAVRAFNELLSSHLDLGPLAQQALHRIIDQMGASGGVLLVDRGGQLEVVASYAVAEPEKMANNDPVSAVIQSMQRRLVQVPEDVALEVPLVRFRPNEILIEPIVNRGTLIGVIILASASGFEQSAKDRLDLFSRSLSLALNNAIVHDRLQTVAAHDPLTAAYNRRFGMIRLHEEMGRSVRMQSPLGVIMFDIDDFKSVNDTYGHLFGDKVLTRMAAIARSAIREGDVLLRYGGEEFAIILPGASREDARQVAERLRRMVAESVTRNAEQQVHVTISVGCTSYPDFDAGDEQDLMRRADEALYEAKRAGKNCVIVK